MLKIDNNQNITLTRGDTLTLTVGLFQEVEGEVVPYVPAAGDVIRFAVSQGYKGQSSYELKLSKDIDNSTLTFTCSSAETALDYETYNYDVEITHDDETVDTFISAKLTSPGEVK